MNGKIINRRVITNSHVELTRDEERQVRRIVAERQALGYYYGEDEALINDARALVVADRKFDGEGRQLRCHGGDIKTT